MILIRSIIYFIFMVVSTILIATLGTLIGWALTNHRIHILDHAWSRVNLWALDAICGLNYRLEGVEHIPEEGCIVFAKHQSAWETIALVSLLPGPKSWVIKRELLYVPFMGWVMIYFKPIAINRKSGRRAVDQIIEQGTQRLKSGRNVFVFPEGTRVAPGTKKRYGIGGALLAEKSGYPVLPVAHNAGVFWRRRDIRKYPGTIDVRIGPVINTQGLTASEINQAAENWIETTVENLPQTHD
ncbi:MAG: 1-acyl-sn-glycerol-3-phosphate acyltransferase [Candidatus Thiodiazotropha sp. (ex Lucinoma annulata)]|nr:1-acyl-sn-glycerol-3-phosphate acyltransferase [Candidatus Thiodiazotropha sp. (ex Lucinoma borealis)]MCU7839858.1 1-acyl-sn-glycerol-3-phosphate acyltransferase [Candidatus Thiodiazotropha sp. (ex Troendleina suluensis)]MCU7883382.1 1-acyl-sn-glycerol-3-phosphate acyltransferase [Candidatus Thiodiazotropha sp. (ex Lucinoma annulata)]MCU7946841.1 1-acyl-sn-glycerol-3-phosphate acyltransferase [Candidatus Thiodiazotropha sp. (ex Cardiolucina cf. quadrata)]MCU7866630.1 1-acyl-sn-glycerol-3-pho